MRVYPSRVLRGLRTSGVVLVLGVGSVVAQAKPNHAPTISAISRQIINEDTSTGAIPFTIGDLETPAASLALVGTSSNTSLVPASSIVFEGSGANRTVTITPAPNKFGTCNVRVRVTDGDGRSSSVLFSVTVNPVNDAPTITAIADQTLHMNAASVASPFTIKDLETPVGRLTLVGTSSDSSLVPDSNIVFKGSGSKRTVTITPAPNKAGTCNVRVQVQDADGGTNSVLFKVTVLSAWPGAFTTKTPVVSFGGNATLNWTVHGTPTSLTLDGVNVLGRTSAVVHPRNRQTYTLAVGSAEGTVSKTVTVAAAGLDVLAGDWDAKGLRDGNLAGAARFGDEAMLVGDSAGNFYVGDKTIIRKIDVSGNVTTLAGSPAWSGFKDGIGSDARIASVQGMALDEAKGMLYFSDTFSAAVRVLNLADNSVTTLVGGPSKPGITPSGTSAILAYQLPKTPLDQAPRIDQCLGLALDQNRSRLYVAAFAWMNSDQVLMIDLKANTIETYAGGSGAGSIRQDEKGSYYGDYSGGTLNELPNHHRLNTPTCAPATLALDESGTLFVGSYLGWFGDLIIKVDPETNLAAKVGKPYSTYSSYPESIAWDSSAKQLLAPTASGQIFRIDPLDGTWTDLQVSLPAAPIYFRPFYVSSGQAYIFTNAGTLSSLGLESKNVSVLGGKMATSGTEDGQGAVASFTSVRPLDLLDSQGRLLLVDGFAIRKVDVAGNVTTFVGSVADRANTDGVGIQARFNVLADIVQNPEGDLFVNDGVCIRKVALDGTVTTLAGGGSNANASLDGVGAAASFCNITAMTLGPDSREIFVNDGRVDFDTPGRWGRINAIRRIDIQTGQVTTLLSSFTGSTYGADYEVSTVQPADGPAGTAIIGDIAKLWLDSNKRICALDFLNYSFCMVRHIGLDGSVETIAGSITGDDAWVDGTRGNLIHIGYLSHYGVDKAGALLFAQSGGVYRIAVDGTLNVLVAPSSNGAFTYDVDGPKGTAQCEAMTITELVPDKASRGIYVGSKYKSSLRRISADGSIKSILRGGDNAPGAFGSTGVFGPTGVVVLPSGDLVYSTGTALMKVTAPNVVK